MPGRELERYCDYIYILLDALARKGSRICSAVALPFPNFAGLHMPAVSLGGFGRLGPVSWANCTEDGSGRVSATTTRATSSINVQSSWSTTAAVNYRTATTASS